MVAEWPNARSTFQVSTAGPSAASTLAGKFTKLAIFDPTESIHTTPTFDLEDETDVHVGWELSGSEIFDLGGTWHVMLNLNQIGGSQQVTLGPIDVPVTITGDPTSFLVTFKIPSRTITEEGLYTVTAIITHSGTVQENELTAMGGYAEIGPAEFVSSPPNY